MQSGRHARTLDGASPSGKRSRGAVKTTRKITIGAVLAIATIVFTVGILAVWAQRQVLNTDNWTDTTTELLENDDVRAALGTYLVQQLYSADAVEQGLSERLPPRLQPLAGPAASGLQEVAQRAAPRLLGTAAALNVWRQANLRAHRLLLKLVRGELAANGEVNLDLRALALQLADSTGLPPAAVDKLPPDVAQLTVLKSDQLEGAQDAVDVLEELPWILGLLTLVLFALAVWLSPDRRRTVLTCGLCLVVAGVAVLAVREIGEGVVVGALADAPNAHAAADDVWHIATSLLVDAAQGAILFGAFISLGAWLWGPGRRATTLRRWAAPALRERPAMVHATLALLILLLIAWGPVPWTRNFWWLLVFSAAAFTWLELLRRRTVDQFPDARAGDWSSPLRRSMQLRRLDRLGRLRESGALTEEEFQREKAALL